MIGAIRWSGIDYRFEAESGRAYRLLLSRRYWQRPRFLNERIVMEALMAPDGSLMPYRMMDLGYDVAGPSFIGIRMVLGLW